MYHYAGNNPVTYIDPDGTTDWKPLTYKALWRIAFESGGLSHSNSRVDRNRIVGKAFENAVGNIFGLKSNTTGFSSFVRGSLVCPDFVKSSTLIYIENEMIKQVSFFPTGTFIEAKTSKRITFDGSTKKQMMAMVNASASQLSLEGLMAGDNRTANLYIVTPFQGSCPYTKWRTLAWFPLNHFSISHYRLFVDYFITPPYNTVIDDSLIRYAAFMHVNLYQFQAEYDKDDPMKIRLHEGILLTPLPPKEFEIPVNIQTVKTGTLVFE